MLRGLLRAGLATALTVAATIAVPTTAHADPGPHVAGTGDLGLAVRAVPSVGGTRLGTIPEGDAVVIACQTTGDDVFGSPLWDRLDSGGYVADWYVDTSGAGVPPCETAVPESDGSGSDGSGTDGPGYADAGSDGPGSDGPGAGSSGYDGAGAARWAVAHAFDPPEYDGADCANFVSAALYYGGGLAATDWWWPHSSSWITTIGLSDGLADHGYLTRQDIDPSDSTIPGAALGDVLLYDVGDGGGFHHVSIVVRIDDTTGIVEVASHTNAFDYRVWNQSWLDSPDPTGYQAQLLHFPTP